MTNPPEFQVTRAARSRCAADLRRAEESLAPLLGAAPPGQGRTRGRRGHRAARPDRDFRRPGREAGHRPRPERDLRLDDGRLRRAVRPEQLVLVRGRLGRARPLRPHDVRRAHLAVRRRRRLRAGPASSASSSAWSPASSAAHRHAPVALGRRPPRRPADPHRRRRGRGVLVDEIRLRLSGSSTSSRACRS